MRVLVIVTYTLSVKPSTETPHNARHFLRARASGCEYRNET